MKIIRTMLASIITLGLLQSNVAAGEFNPVLDIKDPAPKWAALPATDGKRYAFDDFKEKDVLVVAFTCNSCPYAVDYEDRLIAFSRKIKDSKVGFVAINVNKVEEDLLPAMKQRAKEKGFNFPYLFDETQEIAKKYGAGYTPEFFVLNKERQVIYMGAMDDSPDADKVKVRYVDLAIQAAQAGKLPAKQETIAIGCRIRIERKRRTRSGS
ncbi:MAG: thioredoxin family protein [Planctomycetaceae bacterium]|nr:thioredoxin family protein [Planctomycetaceae bacterium]